MNDEDNDDKFPTVGQYRNVPLFAFQNVKRLTTVRADIDAVCDEGNIETLIKIADDAGYAPESRLLAAFKVEAIWEAAVANRKERPDGVDLERLRATVSGLDSRTWADPKHHCSLLDIDDDDAVERDEPLAEDWWLSR